MRLGRPHFLKRQGGDTSSPKLGRIRKAVERARRKQLHRRMGSGAVWQVVESFAKKEIGLKQACEWLGVGRSRLYELRERVLNLAGGKPRDGRWIYRCEKERPSRISLGMQGYLEEELKYLKEESPYFKGHYNFEVLAEEGRRRYGEKLQRNTIRRWAIRQGLYDPKTDETGKPYIRFEMGTIGLLYQHDSSHHAWLPLTKRHDVMILTIDDHSRKVVYAKLVPHDTAWNHLCSVRGAVEAYGCPVAYYTDNAAIFKPMTEIYTQFGRALNALKIELKFTAKAYPEAKGKVEKRFDYFQRRIPYLCERYKITSLTQANKILDESVQAFNELHVHAQTEETPNNRWRKAIEEGRSMLQPIPDKTPMDMIFALHYPRKVKSDGTISFGNQMWRVPNAPLWKEVTVVLKPPTSSRRPHTELTVLYQGSTLAHFVLAKKQNSQDNDLLN